MGVGGTGGTGGTGGGGGGGGKVELTNLMSMNNYITSNTT